MPDVGPKKKPGQNGPSKNGQNFWLAGPKKSNFFDEKRKQKWPKNSVG